MQKCPVKRQGERLQSLGLARQNNLDAWSAEIDREVNGVLQNAKISPWPEASSLFENVS